MSEEFKGVYLPRSSWGFTIVHVIKRMRGRGYRLKMSWTSPRGKIRKKRKTSIPFTILVTLPPSYN
jgi:hypothetical protein